MKQIQISEHLQAILSPEPITLVMGYNEQYKSKVMEMLLTDTKYYSKKFGRIIYIGERKYKSDRIILDETNWRAHADYDEIMDMLDEIKKEEKKRVLFVFNTKEISKYISIIEKLIGIRFTYLTGLIGFLINVHDVTDLSPTIFENTQNIFLFETKYGSKIAKKFSIDEGKIEDKKKKDCWLIGNSKMEIIE